MNDMLSATIAVGTGRRAMLPHHPAAGKTGTGQDYRDAWFVGYTAHYVMGVWVGNDDFTPMKRMTGGSLPSTIWHDVMTYAHIRKEPTALPGGRWQDHQWAVKDNGSFWDFFFGASSNSRQPLLQPATRGTARQSIKRWSKQVFQRN